MLVVQVSHNENRLVDTALQSKNYDKIFLLTNAILCGYYRRWSEMTCIIQAHSFTGKGYALCST